MPGGAANVLVVLLAIAPLPTELATGKYQANYVLGALFFLGLLGRGRFPAAVLVAIAGRAALAAFPPYGSQSLAVFGQVLLMFVVAGATSPDWVAWAGWATGEVFVGIREATGQPRADYGWGDFLLTSAVCSVLFGTTWLVSRRTRAHREIAARAQRAEADLERSTAEAVAAERSRITREMHDVVAHSLTVAVVQCVAAAADLEAGAYEREEVGRRVRAAEDACREALEELRRMLGVLRVGAEPLEPAPRLSEVADLAKSVSAAGVRVDLTLEGDLDNLAPGVELSCYRIVQEALTNTLKHSGAGNARVQIKGDAREVTVRVGDDGHRAGPTHNGSGQGIIGMRERAGAYGGTLYAGPAPEGGFIVEAILPRGPRR